MVKLIWLNGADNTHMFPWWNGEMAIWCNKKKPSHYGEIVKHIWCNCADNIKVKCWNSYTHLIQPSIFLPPQLWGLITLINFIGCCIHCLGVGCIWMILGWSYIWPMSRSNSLWCYTPPPPAFIRFISPFPSSRHCQYQGGGYTIFYLHVYCHLYMFLYWQYN